MGRKRKSVEERKKEVFYTISQIIAEKGLSEVSTIEVAKRLGVSQPAIYKYFKNKDEMIIYFLENLRQELEKITEKAEYGESARQKLKIIITEHMKLINETKSLPKIVFSDVLYVDEDKRKKLEEIVTSYWNKVKEIIEFGIKNGEIKNIDPEFAVRLIMGVILSSSLKWFVNGMKTSILEETDFILDNIFKILLKEKK
ncbi:TetR/AcrR family transcriptional regulator [Persephonella sp.]|uniref:TetR/AcrR family transcriptional regulator n=1 Tax=Persephonella sp. TaxID=2060922 RepID=UPI002604D14B|nr:TetR/AcrR family transcriptional regulator [Persephonella sp.]